MVELVYVTATAVALFALFRRTSLRRPTLQTWLTLTAVLLVAVPGAVTLLSLTAPFFFADPFGADRTVLESTGEASGATARDAGAARAWLVRGFHVIDGNEGRPVAYLETVLAPGRAQPFELEDGSRLTVWLQPETKEGPAPNRTEGALELAFRWKRPGQSRGGRAPLQAADGPVRALAGEALLETQLTDLPLNMAWFGSLLTDCHRPSRIHFVLEPLRRADAVTSISAARWWEAHREAVAARIREVAESPPRLREAFAGSFSFGNVITGSGFILLFGASLLFLMHSPHWVRTVCFLLLYFTLYAGALDRFVLRVHCAALRVGGTDSRCAAAVEAAATRMHPVTAARRLLSAALEDDEPAVQVVALRCLDRERLQQALRGLEGVDRGLQSLTRARDPEIRRAAARILTRQPARGDQP